MIPNPSALAAGLAALLFIPTAAAGAEPSTVSSATVEATLEALTRDVTQGRDNLTAGNALARDALIDTLRGLGVDPAGEGGGFTQGFPEGTNILAVYHPPGTRDQPPVALMGAHYDHLGLDCAQRAEAASPVCNGAADDAGGVTAAVAALEALIGAVDAPVALALWDAEEDGKLGSQHFAAHPSFDVSELRLYINLDIVGANLFRGGEAIHFAVGSESGGPPLMADVAAAAEGGSLDLGLVSYAFGMARSDQDSFVFGGYELPIVFFGDSDGSIYHSTADELHYLNVDKVEAVAQATARLMALAVERGEPYPWVDPLRDGILPVYDDAAVVLHAWRLMLRHARDNQLSAAQLARLTFMAASLQRMVDAGPEAFGPSDALYLIEIAVWGTGLSRALPFVP